MTLAILVAVAMLVGGVALASTNGFGVIFGLPIAMIGATIAIPFAVFLISGDRRAFNTGLVFFSLTAMAGLRLIVTMSFGV